VGTGTARYDRGTVGKNFEESDGKYSLTMEEERAPIPARTNHPWVNSFYRSKTIHHPQINRKMGTPA